MHVDAGEDGAGVLEGGGEDDLADGVAQRLGGDAGDGALGGGGDGGEFARVGAVHGGVGAVAPDLDAGARLERPDADGLGFEGVDEVVEETGGDGDAALGLDLGADPGADADLEVGGGEFDASGVGGDEDVLGDGQRGARRDGALDDAEALPEVLLKAVHVHGSYLNMLWLGLRAAQV